MEPKNPGDRQPTQGIPSDYYQVLVEESFDGIFIQKGTKIWLANKRLHEMLLLEPGELIGKEHWTVYTPEYQALTRQRAQARMRGEDVPPRYPVKLQRKDGSWIYAEINAKAVMVEGEPGVLVWIKDIHDQVMTRMALEQSEHKFKSAFEHAGIGILLIDPNGGILEVNTYLAGILGYDKNELKGKSNSEITYSYDLPLEAEAYRNLLTGLVQNIVFEKRYLKKSGIKIWGRVSSSVVRDEEGVPQYIVSHVQDITREKEIEEQLKEKEAFISSILHAIPDPLIVYDAHMNVKYSNPSFTKVFGWESDEIYGKLPPYLPNEENVITDEDAIRSIVYHGHPYIETKRITKAGVILDVLISGSSLKQTGFEGYVVLLRDITQLNLMRNRVETLEKMESLGSLAGGIAHDFNNILTGILGRSSLVKMDPSLPNGIKRALDEIENCALEASKMVKQLLTYAKGERVEPKDIDINLLIEGTLDMFWRTRKDISVVRLLDRGIGGVRADPTQLRQLFMNLFVNSSDAMPEGGKIILETSEVFLDQGYVAPYGLEPGPYVRITVTDTGMGMTPEVQKRIFEPFFSTKEPGRGTGLGLTMVYSIVKSHRGIIHCYSRPGQGTTFSIYLPSLEGAWEPAPPKKEEEVALPTGKERILVIDDELPVLEVARDLLEYLGYGVSLAESGKEAVQIYRQSPDAFDLILLDIIMPDMGGREVFKTVRGINPRQKILFSSGYSLNGATEELLNQEGVGFVQKPYNLHEMAIRVRDILEKGRD